MIKHSLIIFLILLTQLTLLAQIEWQENGVPVVQPDITLFPENAVKTTDDSAVHYWFHYEAGIRTILAQKIDSNGNKLWGDNGLAIYSSNYISDRIEYCASNDGSAIFSWIIYENEYISRVMVQKVSSNGELMWGDGIQIPNSRAYDYYLKLEPTPNNEVYVSWYDQTAYNLLTTKLNQSGQFTSGWDENHISLEYGSNRDLCSTNDSGFIYLSSNDEGVVTAIRYDEYGNYNPDYLINIFNDEFDIKDLKIVQLPDYGYLAISVTSDIKLCRFDINFDIQWSLELPYQILSSYYELDYAISENGDINFLVYDFGNDLITYKFSTAGELIWEQTISNSLLPMGMDSWFSIDNSEDNGVTLTWQNTGSLKPVYLQKLSYEGDFLFDLPGVIVSEHNNYNNVLHLYTLENNIFVTYLSINEGRKTLMLKIYAADGSLISNPEGIPLSFYNSCSSVNFNFHHHLINGKSAFLYQSGPSSASMQVLDEQGHRSFGNDGLLLSPNNQASYLNSTKAINTDDIIVTWYEENDDESIIYKTKALDLQGTSTWNIDAGINIFPDLSDSIEAVNRHNLSCITINETDYFLNLADYRDSNFLNNLRTQIVSEGEIFTNEGILLDQALYPNSYKLFKNYLAVGIYDNGNITFQLNRIDETGNFDPDWPNELIVADSVSSNFENSITMSDFGDNLLVTWAQTGNGRAIKGQLYTPNGQNIWEEEGKVLYENWTIPNYKILVDDDDFYIVFSQPDYRYSFIELNKYNSSGLNYWNDNLSIFSDVSIDINDVELALLEDKVMITWSQEMPYSEYKSIYAQVVSSDGEILCDSDGIEITHNTWYVGYAKLRTEANTAYISWLDGRKTRYFDGVWGYDAGIYMQKLNFDYLSSPEEEVEPAKIKLSNYPNPFNPTTTISFSLNTEITEETKLEIYNVKGQKIKSFACHPELVEGRQNYLTTWNGTDNQNNRVSTGIYFISLKVDDKIITSKKCVLLK